MKLDEKIFIESIDISLLESNLETLCHCWHLPT